MVTFIKKKKKKKKNLCCYNNEIFNVTVGCYAYANKSSSLLLNILTILYNYTISNEISSV